MADGPAGADDLLTRAKAYPYDLHPSCYALACGGLVPLVSIDLTSALACEVDDEGCTSSLRAWAGRRGIDIDELGEPELLLAYGSNASVAGLSRKLADCLPTSVLPVARGTITDFDVVYSAHISTYGAIPATLHHAPGTRTRVYLLVIGSTLCGRLRETEPNYHFGRLDDLDVRLDLGPRLSSVSAVISFHGALTLDGTEVALSAVDSVNRRFPSLTETQVLQAVGELVAPGLTVDELILENVGDQHLARRRTEALERTARPFAYPSWRPLDSRTPPSGRE